MAENSYVRDVGTDFPHPLISADMLAELLESKARSPSVLDVRWEPTTGTDPGGYREGHIPTAVFVDLDRQLSDPPSERGRHPLPSAERFGAEMRSLGVSESRPVVVYDQATSMAAARAWWLLRYFGHRHVAVLDGGLAGWVARGRPLEVGVSPPPTGDFTARPGAMPVISAAQAPSLASAGVLIDARAGERFAGREEPIDPVAGHIPGAVNHPTADNVAADGRFRSGWELREEFERLGVRHTGAVAAYCGSGVTAAHEVLALELAGYRAALYPGSWSEWITDPARPVARDECSTPPPPAPRAAGPPRAGPPRSGRRP